MNKIIKQNKNIIILKLNHNQELILDIEDYDLIKDFQWYCTYYKKTRSYYCRTNKNNKNFKKLCSTLIHRVIMNVNDPKIKVDHINHNGLDNRKKNLRLSTNAENSRNRGIIKGVIPYHGVYFHKASGKYMAKIRIDNMKRLYLGVFVDPIDAAKTYDEAAKIHHGEFATLNFS